MFTIKKSFDHFDLYTLSDDNGNLLEVVPERGGIISRFEIAGKPVFFLDRDSLNDPSKNVRGGNPILFPICGPLAEGSYEIDGKSYAMKQHGFARNLPWTVINEEAGEKAAALTLRLSNSPE